MTLKNTHEKRIDCRMSIPGKCILVTHFGMIGAQTVDISKIGFGAKTDRTLPLKFKNGCELVVFIPGMEFPQAKLMWIKKDFNNMTRLGLEFLQA